MYLHKSALQKKKISFIFIFFANPKPKKDIPKNVTASFKNSKHLHP